MFNTPCIYVIPYVKMGVVTEFETFEQQCLELIQELQTTSVSKKNILVLNNTHNYSKTCSNNNNVELHSFLLSRFRLEFVNLILFNIYYKWRISKNEKQRK